MKVLKETEEDYGKKPSHILQEAIDGYVTSELYRSESEECVATYLAMTRIRTALAIIDDGAVN
jgi:hypothetical protein